MKGCYTNGITEDIIKHFYLKQIIRENHGQFISHVVCNTRYFPNLIVTIGGTQMHLYNKNTSDNCLDLIMHFYNINTYSIVKILTEQIDHCILSHWKCVNACGDNSKFSIVSEFYDYTNPLSIDAEYRVDETSFDDQLYNNEESCFSANSGNASIVKVLPELFSIHKILNCCLWIALYNKKLLVQSKYDLLVKKCGDAKKPPRLLYDVSVNLVNVDDAWIAVSSNDTLVHLISIANHKVCFTLAGHYEPVLHLTTNKTNTTLASLSDHRIIVWNMFDIARSYYNQHAENLYSKFYKHSLETDDQESYEPTPWMCWPLEKHQKWMLQLIVPKEKLCFIFWTVWGLLAISSFGRPSLYCYIPEKNNSNDHDQIWDFTPSPCFQSNSKTVLWNYARITSINLNYNDVANQKCDLIIVLTQASELIFWTPKKIENDVLIANVTKIVKIQDCKNPSFYSIPESFYIEVQNKRKQSILSYPLSRLLSLGLDFSKDLKFAYLGTYDGKLLVVSINDDSADIESQCHPISHRQENEHTKTIAIAQTVRVLSNSKIETPIMAVLVCKNSNDVLVSSNSVIWRWSYDSLITTKN